MVPRKRVRPLCALLDWVLPVRRPYKRAFPHLETPKEHSMLKVLAQLSNTVRRDDRGVTAVEYALLLIGVGLVLITALAIFGPALGGVFSQFAGKLTSAF
jgi:Flp pilus assembly pilin Flp